MASIDVLLGAAVDSVKRSGVLESGVLMGTITATNADGTVDIQRGADAYPSVRVLRSAGPIKAGGTVEMLKTVGGWVCIGPLSATEHDTGWVDLPLGSGIGPYSGTGSDANPAPSVRRVGPTVYLRGRWSFTTAYAAGSDRVIATVPQGFRPSYPLEIGANVSAMTSGYAGKCWLNNSFQIQFWAGAATSWGGFVAASWLVD